ncbi:unnamed protein product [Tuber melanosporum]|uniref:(Perigord truffle) hypothetical protein n=1 Tax=Tuber melanosporum (strain Mel28) TaxID=656061 RepID=D5GPZ7_TUBMM|nr:uncharacterized protein GSTUM_00012111001 [Tuber melanosporum]CAZ86590.1 unnamed protein product [Tuber melanosporum]
MIFRRQIMILKSTGTYGSGLWVSSASGSELKYKSDKQRNVTEQSIPKSRISEADARVVVKKEERVTDNSHKFSRGWPLVFFCFCFFSLIPEVLWPASTSVLFSSCFSFENLLSLLTAVPLTSPAHPRQFPPSASFPLSTWWIVASYDRFALISAFSLTNILPITRLINDEAINGTKK